MLSTLSHIAQYRRRELRQRGFVGIVVTVIMLLIAIGVIFARSNTNATSGASDNMAKVLATQVMNQANDVKAGVDKLIINGETATTITFNGVAGGTGNVKPTANGAHCLSAGGTPTTTAADCASITASGNTGAASQLFSIDGGGLLPVVAPANALINSATNWIYLGLQMTDGGGTPVDIGSSTVDLAMVLPNLKQSTCKQINNALHGDALTVTPPAASAGALAADMAFKTSGSATPRTEGCVTVSGDYVYFKLLTAQ